ncbi:MAG TPA: YdcF family protein [Terriglobales bacterium]|jgi:uncharacterized SAM-binding protein YcdF (DUF218 family)|nr:YdcF family protein [Terriglobales bacterium]
MATAGTDRRSSRWLFWTTVLAAVMVLAVFSLIFLTILNDSTKQELHPADAIIVFGAAQYDGRPSPVFRARLDHANELFRQGLAPVVITTGGSAADPKFSEGGVGHDYLMRKGIPESALIAETQANDTAESAERVSAIMQKNRMHSCLAVSDAYHMFRIRMLLMHQGLKVFLAPRPDSRPRSFWLSTVALMKESASYLLWRAGLRG